MKQCVTDAPHKRKTPQPLAKLWGVSGGLDWNSGRKTFLTSLASQGVSVFVLASLAVDKSISTTQRYIKVNDDVKRRAVELV